MDLEVHSVGINNISFKEKTKYFYHRIDLSLNNFNLIKELKNLPHPDVILASPPCESWSIADCKGRMTRKIDSEGNWFIQNKNYYEKYNEKCNPVKRRKFLQKERSRLIGEATVGATLEIIESFDPAVWIIENPKTSLTWKFQEYHWNFKGIMNSTYYSTYDENFSLKPTIFKSNIKLNLINKSVKGNRGHMAFGSYSKRSSIPEKLIKDIMNSVFDYLKVEYGTK